jgi:hypothetical protein
MIHVQVGDPPETVGSGSVSSSTCMCSCAICLSGRCCQLERGTSTSSVWTSGGVIRCGGLDHDFERLTDSRIFCRKCGEVRDV